MNKFERPEFRAKAAHFAWSQLPESEREKLRIAGARLLDLKNLGEKSLAELLFVLGQEGYLKHLGGNDGR